MNTTHQTLEQRIKFDHGLTIGTHLIKLTHGDKSKFAYVEITQRGKVNFMWKPDEVDMYSSWSRLTGDELESKSAGGVIVWAARSPEFINQYHALPVAAEIPLKKEPTA